jgi:hypothetical protein
LGDNHDSAVPYFVAVEEVVVSLVAEAEDKDDGQNSMAVGGMENLAAAAVVPDHSVSADYKGDRQQMIVQILPEVAADGGAADSDGAAAAAAAVVVAEVVVALQKDEVTAKAVDFGEA